MNSLLLLFSLSFVLTQPQTHTELSADIWDSEINALLNVSSRMALGSTSKTLKLMTHRLNRLAEAALIPKRQACSFELKLQHSGSGYGLFKNADLFSRSNTTKKLINQATCLEGYVPKISQFEHVFDHLLIQLPIHDSSDDIKVLEDTYLTMLERLFKLKKHYKSVTIGLLLDMRHEEYKFNLRTEERLFRMMRGTTINDLELKFDIRSLNQFSSFASQSIILKLYLNFQSDRRVYEIIPKFKSLKDFHVKSNMNSNQLYKLLESVPSLKSLTIESKFILQVNIFKNIKHLDVRKCTQLITNQSFTGMQSLSFGRYCIQDTHELINILRTNKGTLSKFSIALPSSSDIVNVPLKVFISNLRN